MPQNGGTHAITPLEALELGWSIIPVSRNKSPMLTSWRTYQTRPPSRLEFDEWMKRKPPAWAIICGEVSRRICLDFDGDAGRQTLERLNLEPHRATPSGGFHVDIEQPGWRVPTLNGKIKIELNEKWPALDIRGAGGYAIFTGRIDRGEYAWLRSPEPYPITALPADLIVFTKPPSVPPPESYPEYAAARAGAEFVHRALAQAAQGRNAAGFWLATQLRDNRYDEADAAPLMLDYCRQCPETNSKGELEEYTEAEALASLKQAYNHSARGPWIVNPKKTGANSDKNTPSVPDPPPAAANGAAPTPAYESQAPESGPAPRATQKHFIRTANAVYFTDDETESKIYVCSDLEVVAYARDANSESWGKYLKWTDSAGKEHGWICPMRMLAGDGIQFRETLADGGLEIGTAAKSNTLLTQYVRSERPYRSMFCVPYVGWFNRSFVFPDETIPKDADVGYQSAGRGEHFYHTKGTLKSWQQNISAKCAGNSRLVFAVSAAFAGPLMRPLNVQGGGFHFQGTSSVGKSTTQWVAGSVWGGGGRNGFARTWSATKNALESTAELHNDGCLILDEIRMIDPREIEQIVYMLANGSGKSRETRNLTGRRTLQWQCLILSSGEIQIADCAALAGQKIKGGAEIRMATIPADTGQFGIFETLHGTHDPRVFAESLEAAAKENYGTAIREYLECLITNWDAILDEARDYIEEFIAHNLPAGAAPEIRRVLRRFALVAAAGELATEHSITRWEEGEAEGAARACFRAWIANRGGIEATDAINALRQVRDLIAQEHSRFRPADPPKNAEGEIVTPDRVQHALGFWKRIPPVDGELAYLFDPGAFRREACAGFEPRIVLKELNDRGLLVTNEAERLTIKQEVTLPSGDIARARFYGVRAAILDLQGE